MSLMTIIEQKLLKPECLMYFFVNFLFFQKMLYFTHNKLQYGEYVNRDASIMPANLLE